jgi:hypothetical protein
MLGLSFKEEAYSALADVQPVSMKYLPVLIIEEHGQKNHWL